MAIKLLKTENLEVQRILIFFKPSFEWCSYSFCAILTAFYHLKICNCVLFMEKT